MLKITDLHAHYGQLTALRGVSIEIARGETISIVGPNGAGKSTLLRAISGIRTPTYGRIAWQDRSIVGIPPEKIARLGISMVPEGRHVFGMLTVEENLRVAGAVRKNKGEVTRDIEKVLEYFPRLRERLGQTAGKLSGGEQQMLVIGRALITKPKLMTIDEPSLGLAPVIVDQVYDILMELKKKESLTLLIVQQNTDRAVHVSDRIYVLRNGEIQLEGTAEELRDGVAIERAYFGFETPGSQTQDTQDAQTGGAET